MSNSRQSRSISELSCNVKASLYDLKRRFEIQPDTIDDVLDRYLLWTGNLGALHLASSKLSLDYRLTRAPEIRDQICEILDDLQEAIADLIVIALGNRINQDLHISSENYLLEQELGSKIDNNTTVGPFTSDEAQCALETISQCIRSLFRIGSLVRRAGRPDRFQRALQDPDCVFPALFDIDHVRNKYSKLCKPDTQRLVERMGNANAKRRQFIKYCCDHQSKLIAASEEVGQESSKATTFVPDSSIQSAQLELNATEEEDTVSLSTATTFGSYTRLKLPRLADLSPDSEYFECPICCTIRSFQSDKAWRAHAFRDLKAYVCTVGGQECDDELFSTRDEWFDHELRFHRSKYICTLCNEETDRRATLKSHISSTHSRLIDEQISVLTDAGLVVPTHFKAQDCPFCDDWAEHLRSRGSGNDGSRDNQILVSWSRFKRHVATHQEQLAIFAVPKITEEGTVGENEDISKVEDDISGPEEEIAEAKKNTPKVGEDTSKPNKDMPIENLGNIPKDNTPTKKHTFVPWAGGRGASGGGRASGWGSVDVRWNCCSCFMGGNQSSVYHTECIECEHPRCSDCVTWTK